MAVSSVSTSVASQVTYPVMVNGYLCYSAAEVQAARQGRSPDSVKPGGVDQSQQSAVSSSNSSSSASQSQSALSASLQTYQSNGTTDQNSQDAQRGSLVDFYA